MNLDKQFCASDCTNHECSRMISYSILRAAENRDVDVEMFDFSLVCLDYEDDENETL